jgi:hypothetical protein
LSSILESLSFIPSTREGRFLECIHPYSCHLYVKFIPVCLTIITRRWTCLGVLLSDQSFCTLVSFKRTLPFLHFILLMEVYIYCIPFSSFCEDGSSLHRLTTMVYDMLCSVVLLSLLFTCKPWFTLLSLTHWYCDTFVLFASL